MKCDIKRVVHLDVAPLIDIYTGLKKLMSVNMNMPLFF